MTLILKLHGWGNFAPVKRISLQPEGSFVG